ncbi:MAG: hypothetical protein GY726_11170 [Proteobacteria bacterium]|nr:hypothetical protein [Pseudomonadota bacterium]
MALISKWAKPHGVPELETIDYNDCAAQFEYEYKNKLIQSVEFRGDHIRVEKTG